MSRRQKCSLIFTQQSTVQKLPSIGECRGGNAPPPTSELGEHISPPTGPGWGRQGGVCRDMPALHRPAWARSQGRGRHTRPPPWGCRCPAALGAVVRWVRYVAESSLALAGEPPPGPAVERGVHGSWCSWSAGRYF